VEEEREGMAAGKLQNATLTARVEELEQRESENALSAAQLAGCSSCFHSVLETMALEADDEFTAVIHRTWWSAWRIGAATTSTTSAAVAPRVQRRPKHKQRRRRRVCAQRSAPSMNKWVGTV
jgi:hypothetical protein